MSAHDPLPPEQLFVPCEPASLDFETTEALPELDELIGQDRAVAAVSFGVGIRNGGFNMFVMGPSGSGKHTLVAAFLRRRAAGEPVPASVVYVQNFEDPRRPTALHLPVGRAKPFAHDMDSLIVEMRAAIPAAFEDEEYRARQEALEETFKQRHEELFGEVQRDAEANSVALIRTPMGLGLVPVVDGRPVDPEAFQKLPQDQQQRFGAAIEGLQERLQRVLREVPRLQREQRTQLRALNQEVIRQAVEHLIQDLKRRYQDLPAVAEWIDTVEADIIENAEAFIAAARAESGEMPVLPFVRAPGEAPSFRQYRVNVLVEHDAGEGAPVVHEDHPTLGNLIGRIEHVQQQGTLVTDFNLIKSGALHQANGGYLVLEAVKVLTQPMAWEALKRALRARELRIQSLGHSLSLVDTVSLDPEPVPLEAKVVLVGDRALYYMLAAYDPEFCELFKVQVDFEETMERSAPNVALYARLLATIVAREGLRHLERAAVARIVEESARRAGDAGKLSTQIRGIADLLREAHYWAGEAGHARVTAGDVDRAIEAATDRADRLRDRSLEVIREGTVLIDTAGVRIGQVNGLAVLQLGDFAFGRPSRITARVQLGRGRVVDIEREVELGGPLHSKGVLILQGFLGARFGARRPLALSASLVFEQSYGGVDGDSASSTELYALLSAIGEVPIRQGIAVTGSVNQHGEVQAIGGVNEKIEGFFDVCAARGLTGEQGVLIPAANVRHLMLKRAVREAAASGRFHIYAVATVDQGMEILTGLPAGEPDAEGRYPEGTVNRMVADRLDAFAEWARAFARGGDDGKDAGSG